MASLTRWTESEWTPGVGDGQGGLACCDSWGRKESDTTERLNWTELVENGYMYYVWWVPSLFTETTTTLLISYLPVPNVLGVKKKKSHALTFVPLPQVCSIWVCDQDVSGTDWSRDCHQSLLMTNNDVINLPVSHMEARGYLGGKLPNALAQCCDQFLLRLPPRQLCCLTVAIISLCDQTQWQRTPETQTPQYKYFCL